MESMKTIQQALKELGLPFDADHIMPVALIQRDAFYAGAKAMKGEIQEILDSFGFGGNEKLSEAMEKLYVTAH